jgi:hypothetical protein
MKSPAVTLWYPVANFSSVGHALGLSTMVVVKKNGNQCVSS